MIVLCLLLAAWSSRGPALPVPEELRQKVQALAEDLTATDPAARSSAQAQLLALGPEATGPLLELMLKSPPTRVEAIEMLLPRYGPDAIEALMKAAGQLSSYESRAPWDMAQDAIARMGATALPALRKLLDTSRRDYAMGVLGRMGDLGTLEFVALLKHSDCSVRRSAASALNSRAAPGLADVLVEAVRSRDPCLWTGAALGLAKLRDRRAVDPILIMAESSNPSYRETAVACLGALYEPRLLARLVEAVRRDPDNSVRWAAANALIKAGSEPAAHLGHRYKPLTRDPGEAEAVPTAVALRLFGVGLLIYAILWAGAHWDHAWRRGGLWLSVLLLGGLGFYWGYGVTRITEAMEWWLLFAVVPAVAVIGWSAGTRLLWTLVPLIGGLSLYIVALLSGFWGVVGYVLAGHYLPRLIWALAALTVVAAFAMIFNQPDRAALRRFRIALALGMVAFYAGYGYGWWMLWGGHPPSLLSLSPLT